MKCENCGKNEVTFVYRSNVNGHVEEKHLCSDCAEKLGYTQRLGAQSQRMMQSFFGNSLFGNDFFDDFFSPMPSLLGRRMKMLEDPFDDFFADMPALSAAPARAADRPAAAADAPVALRWLSPVRSCGDDPPASRRAACKAGVGAGGGEWRGHRWSVVGGRHAASGK